MISLNQAAEKGFERVRKPVWKMPEDHIKIDIIDGRLGPWVHIYSPFNIACNSRDPVNKLITEVDPDEEAYIPYEGILPTDPAYIQKQEEFVASMEWEQK